MTADQVKSIRASIRQYVDEMGLRSRVFDLMMNTPSTKIRLLDASVVDDKKLLEELGIDGQDSVYTDLQLTFSAKRKNVSKSEYIRIEAINEHCWRTYSQYFTDYRDAVVNCGKYVWKHKRLPSLQELKDIDGE